MENKQKHKQSKKKPENRLYGLDEDESLQSVNFATPENAYLNEHDQQEQND